jgi:hypothetical protein
LQRSGSDSLGQQDISIFTREEAEADRTRQELNQMLKDADIWG